MMEASSCDEVGIFSPENVGIISPDMTMRSWRRRTAEEATAIFSELALPREVLESGSFDLRRSRNNPFSIASDTLSG